MARLEGTDPSDRLALSLALALALSLALALKLAQTLPLAYSSTRPDPT